MYEMSLFGKCLFHESWLIKKKLLKRNGFFLWIRYFFYLKRIFCEYEIFCILWEFNTVIFWQVAPSIIKKKLLLKQFVQFNVTWDRGEKIDQASGQLQSREGNICYFYLIMWSHSIPFRNSFFEEVLLKVNFTQLPHTRLIGIPC